MPTSGSSFTEDQTILFSGSGTDPDGTLLDESFVWRSDVDGEIGTGRQMTSDALSVATHTITLVVQDDQGAAAVASVGIYVDPQGRVYLDRADEESGAQVQVVYVIPSDGLDRQFDVDQTLSNTVGSFQTWLGAETGGRTLRMDTFAGELDIVFHRLAVNDAAVRSSDFGIDVIAPDLRSAGFDQAGKIYAVYYDGNNPSGQCGGVANWAGDRVAILWLKDDQGSAFCTAFADSPTAAPDVRERIMLHEILHAAGFVDPNAPNHKNFNHVGDSQADVMAVGLGQVFPMVLDFAGDDYYGPNVPSGVLNFAVSPWLRP